MHVIYNMVQVHAYPHKMHVQSQFHNKISGSELNFLFFPPLYDRYSQVENAYVHVIIYV